MPLRTACFRDTINGGAAKRCSRLSVNVLATKLAEGRQHPQPRNLFSLSLPSFMFSVYVPPPHQKHATLALYAQAQDVNLGWWCEGTNKQS